MEWFRLYSVKLQADVRRHRLTLEEQGFLLQICAHVALFDGQVECDAESLRTEVRPLLTPKKFDGLWARCQPLVEEYASDIRAQTEKYGKRSIAGKHAAHMRWQGANADTHCDANADAIGNADRNAVGNANAHANAHAEKTIYRDKKRTPKPPEGAEPDGFGAFWAAYPRRTGKAAALKAWAKLAPDPALIGQIHAALRWQRSQESWQADGGKFIPHPATWLNGRRWEDERPAGAINGTLLDDGGGTPLPPWRPGGAR